MSTDNVMAVSLQAMQGDMARVQQISMNMANALTPGYKRGVAVQAPNLTAFSEAIETAAQQVQAQSSLTMNFQVDARPGTLKRTGQSLDVALMGAGYFEIAAGNGPAYTRQGNFQLDARGRLVTPQGYPVIGRDGEIYLKSANVVISEKGVITDPGANEQDSPLGVLKTVEFDSDVALERLGDGLFGVPAGLATLSGEMGVRQGFLENSNVNSAQEMVLLLQAMRHFEGMYKMTQAHDEMLGMAIRKLGDTN